ncbi:MAG: DNA glycosylase [archaeon]|nr:DNA glycosylase [archaeon]
MSGLEMAPRGIDLSRQLWRVLCPSAQLSLEHTLHGAQTFRWQSVEVQGAARLEPSQGGDRGSAPRLGSVSCGVIGGRCVALWEHPKAQVVYWSGLHPEEQSEEDAARTLACLADYFRLDEDLGALCRTWAGSSACFPRLSERFGEVAEALPGIRLLRQDPEQCVSAFICSQNNNAKRIKAMVDSLSSRYGQLLCSVGGASFYRFPSLHTLAQIDEQSLRGLGFGYRAKYIPQTAAAILQHTEQLAAQHPACQQAGHPLWAALNAHRQLYHDVGNLWLHSLRLAPTEEARSQLQTLAGIGPKVGDCIALFCLDKLAVVPVDVHVQHLAAKYCGFKQSAASLTRSSYEAIAAELVKAFPLHAGWAHNILFAGEFRQIAAPSKRPPTPAKKPEKRPRKM